MNATREKLTFFTGRVCRWLVLFCAAGASWADVVSNRVIRVAALQPQSRLIDWRLTDAREVLRRVDVSLVELERLIEQAAARNCRAVALPEDTLGLGTWLAGNADLATNVLPRAVTRMLERFGSLAARHRIYIVSCNDFAQPDGTIYNTSFFIGPDGREIGRYQKVCPTVHESGRARGERFPVFPTPDLGGVGLLICYDMVFPETARALALGGADIIFHSTLGGAAIGDDEISRAAFRTRAVENFVYLVVAQRGNGSMILSPKGRILAEATGPDSMAVADIDPFGDREGGDAMNSQRDMRARLFRERNPAAFSILTDTNPPVLAKIPETITPRRAQEIASKVLTSGEEEFKAAEGLLRDGKRVEAIRAFERLRNEYPASWIDRASGQRLAKLGVETSTDRTDGLAEKYPGDAGIGNDPEVLFADDFETGDLKKWDQRRGGAFMSGASPNSGRWCVEMRMERGKNTGGDAIKWFMPGADTVYARVYVRFSPDYQYAHHFLWLGANQRTNKWSSFGKAGLKPDGTYFSTGMEPWFAWGRNPPPGELNLYTYFLDMEPDRKMNKYWGNGFFPPGPEQGRDASEHRVIPALDRWQCWEFMIQANSAPEKADGKQAMWLDGKLVGEFSGIRWRNDMDLKVNCFWLQHYGYDPSDPTRQYWKDKQSVWFDNVVVARKYIGPMKRANSAQ